jgi:hypothetical protein
VHVADPLQGVGMGVGMVRGPLGGLDPRDSQVQALEALRDLGLVLNRS